MIKPKEQNCNNWTKVSIDTFVYWNSRCIPAHYCLLTTADFAVWLILLWSIISVVVTNCLPAHSLAAPRLRRSYKERARFRLGEAGSHSGGRAI